jgi:hypothetical protein
MYVNVLKDVKSVGFLMINFLSFFVNEYGLTP